MSKTLLSKDNSKANKKWLRFNQQYLALHEAESGFDAKSSVNSSFDYISPTITSSTLIAGVFFGSHIGLGTAELPLKTGLNLFNLAKPLPSIINTNLDDSQDQFTDYDSHARECLQIQRAVNLSANIFSLPAVGLKVSGSLLPLVGVGGASALAVAGTALSLGVGALGVLAGGIGIYYHSHKMNLAYQHSNALQRWIKELAIYQKMLAEITKCQAEFATIQLNARAKIGLLGQDKLEACLTELKQKKLAQLKLSLTTNLLAKISNQGDYKKAWELLINNSSDTQQLLTNVKEGVLQVAGFIGGHQASAKNQALVKLQEAMQQDSQLQILKEAVSQDPKLIKQKEAYQGLQILKNQKDDKFSQGLSYAKQQAKLDRDKKNLEVDENFFKLNIAAVGLISSGLLLAAGGLTLAHTPPLAITALTVAAGLLTIGVAISIYKYSQTHKSLNERLDNQQQKLAQKQADFLNVADRIDNLNNNYQSLSDSVAMTAMPGLQAI